MNLYAESSAVLAWLLGEDTADAVREVLTDAETVLTSDLTLLECDRVIIRATALGHLTEAQGADRHAHLNAAAAGWHVMRVGREIVERSRRPFPGEPIRALDAIHLASAMVARHAVPGLDLLSLDDRIRTAARQLGMRLQPRAN